MGGGPLGSLGEISPSRDTPRSLVAPPRHNKFARMFQHPLRHPFVWPSEGCFGNQSGCGSALVVVGVGMPRGDSTCRDANPDLAT